jgi:hypothetical protein
VKELTGRASGTTNATPEQGVALLAAVDRYPDWYPDVVKQVEVLERDAGGQPTQVRCKLHVERGPMTRDFDLVMDVRVEAPVLVKLSRVPNERGDAEKFEVTWSLDAGGPTRIGLDLVADLDVPRFLPLGGVGDSMAEGFVSAATRALAS